MRLLLCCTELGLGHVSRIIPLGKKLAERGHELFFFSGGTAYQLLKKEFENVYPCRPVAWYESSHGVIASASVLNILIPLPRYNYAEKRMEIKSPSAAETVERYYDLRKHIRRIKPDLLVSDGDMHALRLAYKWKIPSVYVTNMIRPSYHFSPLLTPGERFTERYVKRCNKIIVPDNPEHTICEYNLGDLDAMKIRHKVELVGSFLDMTPPEGSREEHIFVSISGPLGTRAKLIKTIIPALSQMKTKCIFSFGEPGSRKITRKIRNCHVYNWLTRSQRNELMKTALAVIFSGGHGTCFEVVKHMKPSVCVPTQPEQMANARKLEELKCSVSVKNEKQLKSAILQIEEKKEVFKANVQKLNEFSRRFHGVDNAVKVIEELAKT